MMMYDILTYFSYKYKGNYERVREAIMKKESITETEVDDVVSKINSNVTTLIHKDYPLMFRNAVKPPLVFFYYGNLELLSSRTFVVTGEDNINESYLSVLDDVVNNFVVMNGAETEVEKYTLRQAIKHNKPIVLILNKSINTKDIDEDILSYAKEKGLIISEFYNEPEDSSIGVESQIRLLGIITKGMLIVNSSIHNVLLTSLAIDVFSNSGNVMFFPDEKNNEMNKMLLESGASSVNSFHDIMEVIN